MYQSWVLKALGCLLMLTLNYGFRIVQWLIQSILYYIYGLYNVLCNGDLLFCCFGTFSQQTNIGDAHGCPNVFCSVAITGRFGFEWLACAYFQTRILPLDPHCILTTSPCKMIDFKLMYISLLYPSNIQSIS